MSDHCLWELLQGAGLTEQLLFENWAGRTRRERGRGTAHLSET